MYSIRAQMINQRLESKAGLLRSVNNVSEVDILLVYLVSENASFAMLLSAQIFLYIIRIPTTISICIQESTDHVCDLSCIPN